MVNRKTNTKPVIEPEMEIVSFKVPAPLATKFRKRCKAADETMSRRIRRLIAEDLQEAKAA